MWIVSQQTMESSGQERPRRCHLVSGSNPSSLVPPKLWIWTAASPCSHEDLILMPSLKTKQAQGGTALERLPVPPQSGKCTHHAEFGLSKPSQLSVSSFSRCMIRPRDETWSPGGQHAHPLVGDKDSKLPLSASHGYCQSFRGKKETTFQWPLLPHDWRSGGKPTNGWKVSLSHNSYNLLFHLLL